MAARIGAMHLAGRIVLCSALATSACSAGGPSDREALELVHRYLRATVEAYRTGDAHGVSAVAGSAEAKKIAAIVGAKGDMGLTMDAELIEFGVERIERARGEVLVISRERWRWRDLAIGSGTPTGPESVDRYRIRYHLVSAGKRWLVGGVEFVDPPETSRKDPAGAPPSVFH
jgi:hypothetical protein